MRWRESCWSVYCWMRRSMIEAPKEALGGFREEGALTYSTVSRAFLVNSMQNPCVGVPSRRSVCQRSAP